MRTSHRKWINVIVDLYNKTPNARKLEKKIVDIININFMFSSRHPFNNKDMYCRCIDHHSFVKIIFIIIFLFVERLHMYFP